MLESCTPKCGVIDGQHVYIGSANLDWRSYTQIKEIGVLIENCPVLAIDAEKLFQVYWYLAVTQTQASLPIGHQNTAQISTWQIQNCSSTTKHKPMFTYRLGDKPKGLGDKPKELGDKPKGLGNKHKGLGDKPKGLGDKPKGLGDKPKGLGDKPKGLANKPKGLGDKPKGLANKPKGLEDESKGLGDKPKGLGDKPKGLGDKT
ncbi:phospholipase D3 [Biomphalaria glabrata]|nr:phospholipase D3 [Biomphalaria glabrata]